MTEQTKLKISYSLALLAVLFAISPLLPTFGDWGFDFIGIKLEIRFAYYLLVLLFAVTVYFFGIQLISERATHWVQRIANTCYILAILVPPLYLSLFILTKAANLIATVSKSPNGFLIINIMSAIGGAVVAIAGTYFTSIFSRKLDEKEKNSEIGEISNLESEILSRAEQFLRDGHHDFVIIECFKIVELAIRKALVQESISFRHTMRDMLREAQRHSIIPPSTISLIDEIRIVRNKVTHSSEAAGKDAAQSVLDSTKEILRAMERERSPQEQNLGLAGLDWLHANRDVISDAPEGAWLALSEHGIVAQDKSYQVVKKKADATGRPYMLYQTPFSFRPKGLGGDRS